MKYAIAAALSVALVSQSPVIANHHAGEKHADLEQVLKSEDRVKDAPRDKYRNPTKTLEFFQVKPEHTLVEYGPGGGWYTRVLAPYISQKGKYMAMNSDTSKTNFSTRAREARSKGWSERFPSAVEEWTGVAEDKVTAFESDEIPKGVAGTVDRVVVFRSLHGWMNRNIGDEQLKAIHALLKDDGMVGVVQHRAPESNTHAMSNGTRGYLKQSNIIKLFEAYGFELVGTSEVNANPKDKADYEKGVWHLFPARYHDKENDAKYRPIGESDRMTLLFKKLP